MAGESIGVLQKMYVDDQSSAFNIFSSVCRYVGLSTRPHFEIKGKHSIKRLYLAGFGNKRQWKSILGLSVYGFVVEEIDIADPDFIREMFVRASRLDAGTWINASCNGSHPDNIIYREFWDKSYVNEEHNTNIPQITLNYMSDTEVKDPDFEYIYFGFKDVPIQSEDTINRLASMFPVGSFFYMSKFIGARGFMDGAIYAEYLDREKHIIPYDEAMKKNYIKLSIGADIGYHDFTVFTLVGWTVGFKECVILDYFKINESGSDEIYDKFKKWYEPYHDNYKIGPKVDGVYFDPSPGLILMKTLRNKLLNDFNLLSGTAIKKQIIHRIEANVKLMNADRLIFTDRTEDIFKAFTSAVYTKDRSKTDPRIFTLHLNSDMVDSTEYGQAKYIDVALRRT